MRHLPVAFAFVLLFVVHSIHSSLHTTRGGGTAAASDYEYLTFFMNKVMRYDVESTNLMPELSFNITFPPKAKGHVFLSQTQEVNGFIYGQIGYPPTWAQYLIYTLLYKYDVKNKIMSQQNVQDVEDMLYSSLFADPVSNRLYVTKSDMIVEFDIDTLKLKQNVFNLTKALGAGHSFSGGYYMESDRSYTLISAGYGKLVTIDLSLIPEVASDSVNIVKRVADMPEGSGDFVVDPSVKTSDGVPIVFSLFQNYVYAIRHDDLSVVNKVQVVPDFIDKYTASRAFVNTLTHELIVSSPITHTGYNYFFTMDTTTMKPNPKYSISKDPNFAYQHTNFVVVTK